jgi:CBS-domain-containing membrane protein
MWRQDCGIVPVLDDARRVIGVITDRDICMAVATRHRRPEDLTAREVMSGKLFSVYPDDKVRTALETMRAERVRRLPVVDAERRLQGIVSINDVVLNAQPSGARMAAHPSANDVLATLQSICRHSLRAKPPERKDEPVPAHA